MCAFPTNNFHTIITRLNMILQLFAKGLKDKLSQYLPLEGESVGQDRKIMLWFGSAFIANS